MIVGEQKPLDEIKEMIAGYQKVLIVGCGTCVAVCFAGGEKEVGILASSLRMATQLDGNKKQITEATVQRHTRATTDDQHLLIAGERLDMFFLSSAEGARFAEIVTEMTERIKKLGPNPLGNGARGEAG